jgi:hypothetical protein
MILLLGTTVAPSINTIVIAQEIIEPNLEEKQFKRLSELIEDIISSYERTISSLSTNTHDCDCNNDSTDQWSFPVLCKLLIPLVVLSQYLYFLSGITFLGDFMLILGERLNCWWT